MNEGMEIFKGCDFLFFGIFLIKKSFYLIKKKKKSQNLFENLIFQ